MLAGILSDVLAFIMDQAARDAEMEVDADMLEVDGDMLDAVLAELVGDGMFDDMDTENFCGMVRCRPELPTESVKSASRFDSCFVPQKRSREEETGSRYGEPAAFLVADGEPVACLAAAMLDNKRLKEQLVSATSSNDALTERNELLTARFKALNPSELSSIHGREGIEAWPSKLTTESGYLTRAGPEHLGVPELQWTDAKRDLFASGLVSARVSGCTACVPAKEWAIPLFDALLQGLMALDLISVAETGGLAALLQPTSMLAALEDWKYAPCLHVGRMATPNTLHPVLAHCTTRGLIPLLAASLAGPGATGAWRRKTRSRTPPRPPASFPLATRRSCRTSPASPSPPTTTTGVACQPRGRAWRPTPTRRQGTLRSPSSLSTCCTATGNQRASRRSAPTSTRPPPSS